jgi:hypothetical protein
LILLRKFKITPFSTFLDSLDKNSFINALTDSFEILVTLAKIYRQLFKKYKKNENFKNNATFIIIDFNGEYIDDAIVSEERKNSYDLTTSIKNSLILLRKFKITPFSTFLDSLDKNSFINALTDSFEILVFLIVLLKNGCWGPALSWAAEYILHSKSHRKDLCKF